MLFLWVVVEGLDGGACGRMCECVCLHTREKQFTYVVAIRCRRNIVEICMATCSILERLHNGIPRVGLIFNHCFQ